MEKLDIARCRRGMAQLRVEGTPRPSLIEEAITLISSAPHDALVRRYLGIKNYAGFGDQREDHEYGFGPAHGHIVFRIERTDSARTAGFCLNADAIYYLEAYRDFPSVQWKNREGRDVMLSLGDAIREFDNLTTRRNKLADAFEAVLVDVHVGESMSVNAGATPSEMGVPVSAHRSSSSEGR